MPGAAVLHVKCRFGIPPSPGPFPRQAPGSAPQVALRGGRGEVLGEGGGKAAPLSQLFSPSPKRRAASGRGKQGVGQTYLLVYPSLYVLDDEQFVLYVQSDDIIFN